LYAQPVKVTTKGVGDGKKLYINVASCIRAVEPAALREERNPPNCKMDRGVVVTVMSHAGLAEEQVVGIPFVVVEETVEKDTELVTTTDPDVWVNSSSASRRAAATAVTDGVPRPKILKRTACLMKGNEKKKHRK